MSIVQKWNEAINAMSQQGSWYCSGTVNPPSLQVNGDKVYFPISPDTFTKMRSVAEPAPFGKGDQTIVDETVRKGLQIDPSQVKFCNTTSWNNKLQTIAQELRNAYQRQDISLHFYKMLLYEAGGHFASHKDTLRDKTHIASVLISLPVEGGCEGGVLRVSAPGGATTNTTATAATEADTATAAAAATTAGDVMEWSGRCDDVEGSWCSFYTDCQHELLPVTGGRRVVLAYEVRSNDEMKLVTPTKGPKDTAVVDLLMASLKCGSPVILLQHLYPRGCEPKHLKGFDRSLFEMVKSYFENDNVISMESVELVATCRFEGCYDYDDEAYPVFIELKACGDLEERCNNTMVNSYYDRYPGWDDDWRDKNEGSICGSYWYMSSDVRGLTSKDLFTVNMSDNGEPVVTPNPDALVAPTTNDDDDHQGDQSKTLRSQYFYCKGFVFLFNTDNFEMRKMIGRHEETTGNEASSEELRYKFYVITVEPREHKAAVEEARRLKKQKREEANKGK